MDPWILFKDPWTCPHQTLRTEVVYCSDVAGGNKLCSARPISSQPVGRPFSTMGLQDEQHWTTVHSVTPFPSSDPRPQPCWPSSIFQVPHSSNSQPFTSQHVQIFKAGPAGHKLNGDVLICPPASRWLSVSAVSVVTSRHTKKKEKKKSWNASVLFVHF